MLKIANNKEINDYFNTTALSQSLLKRLDKSVTEITKGLDPNKPYLKIGSAVDIILTGHEGQFEKNFFVMDVKLPSDSIIGIINIVFEEVLEDYSNYLQEAEPDTEDSLTEGGLTSLQGFVGQLESYEPYILHACENVGYGKSYKEETRLKKVTEHSSYFQALVEGYGKTILSPAEKETIDSVVKSLKSNHRTSKYFNRGAWENSENLEIQYQVPLYFTFEEVYCKALLDIAIFEKDADGKIIRVIPIDLKTSMGDTFDFAKSVKNFRYDIQAAWYTKALKISFGQDVTIDPFLFIVESTTNPGKPLVYEITDEIINFAFQGDDYRPGIYYLIDRYKFYQEHGYELEKEIVEANNEPLKLGLNGIISEDFRAEEFGNWENI